MDNYDSHLVTSSVVTQNKFLGANYRQIFFIFSHSSDGGDFLMSSLLAK